jgi:hypothetical protein
MTGCDSSEMRIHSWQTSNFFTVYLVINLWYR